MIQNGTDVNFRGLEGYTPLLLAVEQGFILGLKFLLASGADRNLTRDDGQGILDLVSDEDADTESFNGYSLFASPSSPGMR